MVLSLSSKRAVKCLEVPVVLIGIQEFSLPNNSCTTRSTSCPSSIFLDQYHEEFTPDRNVQGKHQIEGGLLSVTPLAASATSQDAYISSAILPQYIVQTLQARL